ncbi:LL-diaminopimelate aminotransferase [Virgibacillus indicus]|uniref:Aminotransferase n=1 Tax=Virgibacillus indicus TaxID=2024554 RepID=A0A265N6W3_9BACI|nr:LL-diaminopimelate aminotransferase [Virgibacillus indicus]OZU87723.1 LL-diaminopimelate aminotransferase [Virgibacillus indicus]
MTFVSDKVKNLPPYLFSEFQRKKKELENKGVDVIDLGIGAPDLPTPDFIIDAMMEEAKISENHRYSTYSGCIEFKEAVADFYKKNYDVELDPEQEILTLIGSKEGIANLIQAVINPGDTVLVPDPGYPVYRNGVHLAGGVSVSLPLDKENGYVPLYDNLSEAEINRSKLMFLNYPGNPTSATVELDTFLEAISFAEENNLLLANDAAYDLLTFDDYKSPSVLQVPNAKDFAVEFGSLSKSFNMTGWRIGYVVGNKEVIRALGTLKSNLDTSQFLPIQKAAAVALKSDLSAVKANNRIYKKRMEKMHQALLEIGIAAEKPKGTIFLWAKVPDGFSSIEFANELLEEAGIIVTPGTGFGPTGEGYFRIALSVTTERIDEVISRLKQLKLKASAGEI